MGLGLGREPRELYLCMPRPLRRPRRSMKVPLVWREGLGPGLGLGSGSGLG